MNTELFLNKIKSLADSNDLIELYPLDNPKALNRFWDRLFWFPDLKQLKLSWLNDLYKHTNGMDLINYYIVPYNAYFNKKPQAFDDFCREWIVNQENPNEILADFYAFMTDRHSLVGFVDNLRDAEGNNFIAYSAVPQKLKDIQIIFSSVYKLYDYIIETITHGKMLDFSHPSEFWKERDDVLKKAYDENIILNYKLKYIFQDESDIYKDLSNRT